MSVEERSSSRPSRIPAPAIRSLQLSRMIITISAMLLLTVNPGDHLGRRNMAKGVVGGAGTGSRIIEATLFECFDAVHHLSGAGGQFPANATGRCLRFESGQHLRFAKDLM